MSEAQKKFWKTVLLNSIVTFAGVTLILGGADYYAIKKAQQKVTPKTT